MPYLTYVSKNMFYMSKNFYKAEEYHQDYYNENPWEPYNLSVVRPKVKHFEVMFAGKMK